WQTLDVGRRSDLELRYLHLDLKRVAAPWVAPEIRIGEAAGCRGRNKRAGHIGGRDPKLPGAIAIDLDIERGVIDRLRILQVPQVRNLRELFFHFGRERSA